MLQRLSHNCFKCSYSCSGSSAQQLDMVIEYNWYEWMVMSKIHLVARVASMDNVCNVLYLSCIIDTVSNSKEFSFSKYYIHCMINSFGSNFLFSTDMWDQSSNVVFDTDIRNDKYYVLIDKWILVDTIEFVTINNFCISVFLVN